MDTTPATASGGPAGPARRIVHVVETLEVGGLERVVLSLAQWQRAQGHAVTVVCLFHEGAWGPAARAAGLDVVAVGKRRGLDLAVLGRLREVLRARSVDVLHTHNPMAHYYAAATWLWRGPRSVVNTRHGMGDSGASRRGRVLYALAARRAHAAVAVCEAARHRFVAARAFPPGRSHVVHNGAAIGDGTPTARAAGRAVAELIGRVPAGPVLGTVGRLSPVKDQGTLLRALARLRAAGQEAELLLVGDGPQRAALEALARELGLAERVHFLGWRDDIARLLTLLDLFVLPSLSEGWSLALVEAAAAGLPIVATDTGGNGEIVRHRDRGWLVPAARPDALADALAMLLDDEALRHRLGEAARHWVLQHCSVAAMGRAYQALYDGTP